MKYNRNLGLVGTLLLCCLSQVAFSLSFKETFEASEGMAGTPGSLNGQNGWQVTGEGSAWVQTNSVFEGSQAAAINNTSVSHGFTNGYTNVWISYQLEMTRGSAPTEIPENMAAVFFVNLDGYLCAYNGQECVVLPTLVPDGWNRFDFYCDYTTKRWDLRFNREQVVSGFGFHGTPDAFSLIRFDANSSGNSYLDDVQVDFENPDVDGDGYTNAEEILYGSDTNSAASIPTVEIFGTIQYSGSETGTIRIVADTYSDQWDSPFYQEIAGQGAYSLTTPALSSLRIRAWCDADGNGLCDPWEARGEYEFNPCYFTNSASNVNITLSDYRQDYSVPFTETFEASPDMAGMLGSLNGQHGWEVTGAGSALVQTNTAFGGSQAAAINNASVSHEFVGGKTNVWISYQLEMARGGAPTEVPDNMAVVFFTNSDGYLCAYNGQQCVELPTVVPAGLNRFDFHCDYTAKRWDLRFNRELVVTNFGFHGSPDAFSLVRLDANGSSSSYLDDVQIVFENPDVDGDGYTNDEEIEAGTNPESADSVPFAAVSGTIHYSGSETGTISVAAVTDPDSWDPVVEVQLFAAGGYSFNAPTMTNVWVKAWLDSDGDGVGDMDEVQAIYGPVSLNQPLDGVDLTLDYLDSDQDGLKDYEEVQQYQTYPNNPDSDGDGVFDGDEVAFRTNPLEAMVLVQSQGEVLWLDKVVSTESNMVLIAREDGLWYDPRDGRELQPVTYGTLLFHMSTNVFDGFYWDSNDEMLPLP